MRLDAQPATRRYTDWQTCGMATTTIKVPVELRDRINRDAREHGVTAAGLIERLPDAYERRQCMEAFGRAVRGADVTYWDEFRDWDVTGMAEPRRPPRRAPGSAEANLRDDRATQDRDPRPTCRRAGCRGRRDHAPGGWVAPRLPCPALTGCPSTQPTRRWQRSLGSGGPPCTRNARDFVASGVEQIDRWAEGALSNPRPALLGFTSGAGWAPSPHRSRSLVRS